MRMSIAMALKSQSTLLKSKLQKRPASFANGRVFQSWSWFS